MTEEQHKAVNDIMDWFDFEKVHKVMKYLRWNWVSAEDGIPYLGEIKSQARDLLTRSIQEGQGLGTGGFQVTYLPHENYLKLEFIVSDFETTIN
jgi:hypothetical protein